MRTRRSQNVKKHHMLGELLEARLEVKSQKKADGLEQGRMRGHAQGIRHFAKSEQNMQVFWQSEKRWHAWDT